MSALSLHVAAAAVAVWVLAALLRRGVRALLPGSRARRRALAARLAAYQAPGGYLIWRDGTGRDHREHCPNGLALQQRTAVLRALGTPVRVIPAPHSAIRRQRDRP
jgi:hypothetical protein